MKAMILAAGYGARFRPVTYTIPKPMMPVCNRPVIAWAIESFLRYGTSDFIVNLHHLPETMEHYLPDRYGDEARFTFSFEAEILGTGGGVRKVRALLDGDEFFLASGDTIQFAPFDALRRARRDREALAALTLRHPPKDDHYTAVWYGDERVTGFGKGTGEALMFSGSHLISRRIFDYLPDRDVSNIVDDVYKPLAETGTVVIAAVVDDGLWFDIGTPQRYLSASRALREATVRGDLEPARGTRVAGDSLVHDSARVRGATSRSIAGERSIVEGTLRDSIVWDDCHIAPGVALDSCIVAHGVELITPGAHRNLLICRDDAAIPRDEDDYRFEDGLVLRDI